MSDKEKDMYMHQGIILHDYFEFLDGGGNLCRILSEESNLAICYGFSKNRHPYLKNIKSQFNLNARSNIPLLRQFKLCKAFENNTKFLKDYKTVIYSGFYTPLAVANHLNGENIFYCHTPPRFIYDKKSFYLDSVPVVARPFLKEFINYLQPRYEQSIKRMQVVLANSEYVKKRIKKYLGINVDVVYPPCDTRGFVWKGVGDYYLSTARLDPLKRIDKIVQAFLKMPNKNLVVTSDGLELSSLKKLCKNSTNIHFTGSVDQDKLFDLVGNAIAILYIPKDEDFGISAIEAMSAGKPVIGVAEGGLLETIIDGKTGILLKPDFDINDIVHAVMRLNPERAASLRPLCEHQANNFTIETFIQKMGKII